MSRSPQGGHDVAPIDLFGPNLVDRESGLILPTTSPVVGRGNQADPKGLRERCFTEFRKQSVNPYF
jgi:hypothetical protein